LAGRRGIRGADTKKRKKARGKEEERDRKGDTEVEEDRE